MCIDLVPYSDFSDWTLVPIQPSSSQAKHNDHVYGPIIYVMKNGSRRTYPQFIYLVVWAMKNAIAYSVSSVHGPQDQKLRPLDINDYTDGDSASYFTWSMIQVIEASKNPRYRSPNMQPLDLNGDSSWYIPCASYVVGPAKTWTDLEHDLEIWRSRPSCIGVAHKLPSVLLGTVIKSSHALYQFFKPLLMSKQYLPTSCMTPPALDSGIGMPQSRGGCVLEEGSDVEPDETKLIPYREHERVDKEDIPVLLSCSTNSIREVRVRCGEVNAVSEGENTPVLSLSKGLPQVTLRLGGIPEFDRWLQTAVKARQSTIPHARISNAEVARGTST